MLRNFLLKSDTTKSDNSYKKYEKKIKRNRKRAERKLKTWQKVFKKIFYPMCKNDSIYIVTTACDVVEDKFSTKFYNNGETKLYKLQDTRTVAFYHDLSQAQKSVLENWGDIWETCYKYVMIEEVAPGLYPTMIYKDDKQRWWYKWNNEFKRYEEFDGVKNYSMEEFNYVIG